MVIMPGGGHGWPVDVTQRYDMLMARLGWPDESAPEAVCLLDLVTAVETYYESAMRRITIVEGTAAQLREGSAGQAVRRHVVVSAWS
jgi:hypothetical protein